MTKKILFTEGKQKASILSKIVMFTLVISTITDFYGFGSFNFTYIASVALAILCILKNGGIKNVMPKFLTVYLVWYAVVHYMSISSVTPSTIIPLGLIKIFLVYAMLFYEFDFTIFYKYFRLVALACIAYFLIQFFTLHTTGIKLPSLIPGLPVITGVDGATFNIYAEVNIAKGYDGILTSIYGSYMELPPLENRVAKHDFVAYWKEPISI